MKTLCQAAFHHWEGPQVRPCSPFSTHHLTVIFSPRWCGSHELHPQRPWGSRMATERPMGGGRGRVLEGNQHEGDFSELTGKAWNFVKSPNFQAPSL